MTPIEHVCQVLNNQARIAKGAGNGCEQHIWEQLLDCAAAYEEWLANWRESSRQSDKFLLALLPPIRPTMPNRPIKPH